MVSASLATYARANTVEKYLADAQAPNKVLVSRLPKPAGI